MERSSLAVRPSGLRGILRGGKSGTNAGTKGERAPSENERATARLQGKDVASLAPKLVR